MRKFIDNVYETITDHHDCNDSESDLDVDYGMLMHLLSNYIF
jgi:hypothetical protein